MPRVARNLADVIDVVDDPLERHAGAFGRRFASHPAGDDHPRVERRADDGAARDELADLVVVELPVVVDDRAAVRVARPDVATEMVESVAKTLVAEMRGVEDHPETFHLADELAAARAEVTLRVGALRVHARPVMPWTHRPQPLRIRALEMPDGDE